MYQSKGFPSYLRSYASVHPLIINLLLSFYLSVKKAYETMIIKTINDKNLISKYKQKERMNKLFIYALSSAFIQNF